MASRGVQSKKPIQVGLNDGSIFVCSCGSAEFRVTDDGAPLHLFCRCGQVYTEKDLPPLRG